ncbi:hypothetical protein BpHYR1_052186 [Brachionus plicatilis]|uniref:Uncharacterized protein n=1 Tax=Brachionus plicatilis TaxID=10195 RepID=A0A3M7S4I7_BRAPC|nr:hypothetical protein BpHYR1_052186 [Brachionus plicatilis]
MTIDLGQLEIIDARHHRRQIIVRIHARRVHGLFDNGQRGTERAETANGQPRTAGHKLQEHSLLVGIKLAHYLEQILDRAALVRVPMIASSALGQTLGVPFFETRAAKKPVHLVGIEDAQALQRQHRLEALSEAVDLRLNALGQCPLDHQSQVVVQIFQAHRFVLAGLDQFEVGIAGECEVELQVGHLFFQRFQIAVQRRARRLLLPVGLDEESAPFVNVGAQRFDARVHLFVDQGQVLLLNGGLGLAAHQPLVEHGTQMNVEDAEVLGRLGHKFAQQSELLLLFVQNGRPFGRLFAAGT